MNKWVLKQKARRALVRTPPKAMSCMSWNCRGLGNAVTVKELRDFAKNFAPTVLCVLETQVHKARVEGLKCTLGYDNAFAVSSSGRSGGLGIFWEIIQEWRFYRILSIILILLLWLVLESRGGLHVSTTRHKPMNDTKHGIC
jgi:hypothetical protein